MTPSASDISLLLIAAYFIFLLASLLRRGKVISGPWLFLLRSFFPNWRFYHGLGHQPRLFVRILDSTGQWQSWEMFMPRAPFHLGDLFHNPRNNLALANQNLVDHLSADVQALPDDGDVRDLQDAFVRHNALQCGFCTPGMVMAAKELLQARPDASRAEVREWMSGNYCRCTGYHAIVDAICETLAQRAAQAGGAATGKVSA